MAAIVNPAIETSAEPIEYRACVVCGEIQDRELMSECVCGQFECTKHVCPCTPAWWIDAA
jgi:hypothetical protein